MKKGKKSYHIADTQTKKQKSSHQRIGSCNYEPTNTDKNMPCYSMPLSQRQPICKGKQGRKNEKTDWTKYFKFQKPIPEPSKTLSKNSISNMGKTQIINKTENFFTSFAFKEKKIKRKQMKKKSNIYDKRKCKTPTDKIYCSSKLASFHSVNCSFVDNDKEDYIQYENTMGDILQNLNTNDLDESFEDEMKFYEKFHNKSTLTQTTEEENESTIQTKNLIQKYIQTNHQKKKVLWKVEKMLGQVQKIQKEEDIDLPKNQLVKMPIKNYQIFLKNKIELLKEQKKKDIYAIQEKFDSGKISQMSLIMEKRKINKWTAYEVENTEKVRKIFNQGISKAIQLLSDFDYSKFEKLKLHEQSKSFSYFKRKYSLTTKQKDKEQLQKTSQGFKLDLKKIPQWKQEQKIEALKISEQQKSQLFQYVFVHLCIQAIQDEEMTYEFSDRICRKLRKNIKLEKKRKGFNSGIPQITKFLNQFLDSVLGDQQEMSKIVKNIQIPLGPTPFEMLSYIRGSEESKAEQFNYVFGHKTFDKFSKSYIDKQNYGKYFQNAEAEKKRIAFLQRAQHLHQKAIFDAVNEICDKHRPYGLFGKPFPWKKQKLVHKYSKTHMNKIIKNVKDEVHECCSLLCGIFHGSENQFEGFKLTENELQMLRSERLSRMLGQDVMENDNQWYFLDDEQTELLLSVTGEICSELMGEFASELMIF